MYTANYLTNSFGRPSACRGSKPMMRKDNDTDYFLADWLNLHGLSRHQCRQMLNRSATLPQDTVHASCVPVASGEAAWQIAALAMARLFPFATDLVERTRTRTRRNFLATVTRPITIPGAMSAPPTVRLAWHGRAADLLIVAHEFGHALQATAAGSVFVPPVNREICAFVAEHALITSLGRTNSDLCASVRPAWASANDIYVSRCGNKLRAALDDPRARYHYDWNYPVARGLAADLFSALDPDQLFGLYTNPVSPGGLIRFLGCPGRHRPSCDAACLAFRPAAQTGADTLPP